MSHTISAEDRSAAVRVLARLHRLLESVDSGLTLPQYRVLAALAQGGVRSAHLAERLAVRRPTLTAIADGLVAAGYAERESEAGDRRVVRLIATDAGRAILAVSGTASRSGNARSLYRSNIVALWTTWIPDPIQAIFFRRRSRAAQQSSLP